MPFAQFRADLTRAMNRRRLYARINALPQNSIIPMMFDDRVMARRDVVAAEGFCFFPEITKL